jgi:hypothetical protein
MGQKDQLTLIGYARHQEDFYGLPESWLLETQEFGGSEVGCRRLGSWHRPWY